MSKSESHIEEVPSQQPQQEPATDALVPEGATIAPEPALEPSSEPSSSESHEEHLKATSTSTEPEAAATTAPAKPSRLSLAFQKISCGLCFHPLKNNNATDYHALVVTPTDEDGPGFGQDYHDTDHSAPAHITEDFKGDHSVHAGASSSTDHHLSALGEAENKSKAAEEEVTSTIIEEITIVEGSSAQVPRIEEVVQETIIDRQVPRDTVQEESSLAVPGAGKNNKSSSASSSPATSRVGKFAKLAKRSSSTSNVTRSSSNGPSSPLLGRLGRLAKNIRTNNTTSSTQSKVESLKIAEEPTVNQPEMSTTKPDNAIAAIALQTSPKDLQVDFHETVMSDDDNDDDDEPNNLHALMEEPQELKTAVMPFDSSAPVDVPESLAIKIPGQPSPSANWAQSPTLHQNDASASTSSPSHFLTKAGRSSTAGSTVGGASETASLGSSDKNSGVGLNEVEGGKFQNKRRPSVLKKIGKIMKNSNEKRKEKRMSRQNSSAMTSPIEADEQVARF
ncbi:hypothetical protein BC939DRAFT_477411 [Gamsiella multidivaricata]|uniref:uncharacterized protein n=1 Tax=Gamsiella multidivaricata TaxID=101098 RepID=UPI00222123E1|nr:uncharacterized protein BC939DRAFT_477411 [Gamsiella multidivaricata]KAI7822975.1 hypothetical protein BC939DRAFT_477411 [Gamsiella multidivaricata]